MEGSENTPLIVNDESLEAGQGNFYYYYHFFLIQRSMTHNKNINKKKSLKRVLFISSMKIFCIFLNFFNIATVSSIGPDELPPPFQQEMSGGVPMVTCRVCQAMIDITWKREQHVVKCTQCNEATVR